MGENVNGFNAFYNNLLAGKGYYEADMSKSYQANLCDLRQKVFLKNTCATVYKRAAETFGEGYGEKLVELLVKGAIQIPQIERYPFKEFPTLETYLFTLHYLNKSAFMHSTNNKVLNHVQFIADIENLIVSQLKLGRAVNIMDLSMSLAVYLQRAVNLTIVSNIRLPQVKDRIKFFEQLVYRLVHVFSVHSDECDQPVTFSILDKTSYLAIMTNHRFSKRKDRNRFENMLYGGMAMDYSYYMQTVEHMLHALNVMARMWKDYRTPKVRVYLACADMRAKQFYESVASLTHCLYSQVAAYFRGIKIYEGTDVYSEKFQNALANCLVTSSHALKVRKERNKYLPIEEITEILKNTLQANVPDENKLVVVDNDMQDLVYSQVRLPSQLELVYYRPESGNIFVPPVSETTINYRYLAENTNGLEDYKTRLADAYVDAQTINQLRRKLVGNNWGGLRDHILDRLNVKIADIDEDLFYVTCNVIDEQNKLLKATYGDRFTYEIVKTMSVNEKFAKFYIL